jgi:glutamyl-Q tRNA(Asp) synthetase
VTHIGRFAPSPSGPLHRGSLVAALGSWLDARAHGGRWLLRIEDVDAARSQRYATALIQAQLTSLGLTWEGDVCLQSTRADAYREALDTLVAGGLAYPCTCTRQIIDARLAELGRSAARGRERVYPGTCRAGPSDGRAHAWRLRVGRGAGAVEAPRWLEWTDRRLGPQRQDLANEVGDFLLRRADGPWAYQLAVVVDDAAQGVTHIVRGEDLVDNTARQILLQRMLGLPTPSYLHLPLVLDAHGEKLSKSNGAPPLNVAGHADALRLLHEAATHLGLRGLPPPRDSSTADWLAAAVACWRAQVTIVN